jgi:RimJ/RimL family protein N-acetyltransferase
MLEGRRIRLRALDRAHLARTLVWVNDPELAGFLDRSRPVSDIEHERWYQNLLERRDRQYFAIELVDGGAHVGNVWLWDIETRHRRAEVRILIGEAAGLDQGFGPEALELVTSHAFDRLNLHKVYAYVLETNPRARRAFEKAGFRPEGLLRSDRWADGRYVDVHVLARVREESS